MKYYLYRASGYAYLNVTLTIAVGKARYLGRFEVPSYLLYVVGSYLTLPYLATCSYDWQTAM